MKHQTFDPESVRVVLFDLFGTLVDFSGVPHEERKAYADHIRKPEWSPFRPPESWCELKAFPDVREGLANLYTRRRLPVILSNCPARLAKSIVRRNRLDIDIVIQLAAARVFKPHPRAYQAACDVLDVDPSACLMVTANEHFGDLEQSRALGMQACLIRGDSDVPGLVSLAERLGG